MNPKIKSGLYAIISIVGNGAIFSFIPAPFNGYAAVVFNIIQVVYAFYDPSYVIHQISIGKRDSLGHKV